MVSDERHSISATGFAGLVLVFLLPPLAPRRARLSSLSTTARFTSMSLADDSDLYGGAQTLPSAAELLEHVVTKTDSCSHTARISSSDLYGADDPDYNDGGAAVAMKDEPLEVHAPSPPAPQPAAVKSELDSASYNLPPASSIPAKPMMGLGLPAKPDLAGAGNGPQPIPSYSSQVAQQFQSSYKQPQQSQSQPLGGGSDALVLGGGGGGAGGVNRAGGMVGVGLGASGPGASAEAVDMNAALGASVRPSQMKDEG